MSARTLRIRLIGTSALALSVASCGAFGPERNPPQMASPGHYAAKDQSLEMPAADGAAQRLNAGARPVPEWWKEYGSDALDALVDEGLRNSPSLASAQSTLKAAREGLRAQIGQNLWPNVDVGFSPSRQRALAIPTLSQQTFLYNVFAAEVKTSTSYTFDFFGAAVLADRALARQVQQQDYQLESVRRALAANIVVATINAAALQEQVTATEELVALGERRAQQTAARYALGSASLDDNLAAQEDAALLEGYRHVEVASVSDALEQIAGRKMYLSHRMRPIFSTRFAGFALTVALKKETNHDPDALKGMLAAIDQGAPNSVYVMVVEDGADIAGMGGLMGTAMSARDFSGAVIDGGVRDVAYLQKIGFPVYALGVVPSTSIGHYRFAGSNIRVVCDGVEVNPADIIVADPDGIVVAPRALAPKVLALAQEMDFKEHSMYAVIEKLKSIEEAVKKFGRL